jgi:hypothetical protein
MPERGPGPGYEQGELFKLGGDEAGQEQADAREPRERPYSEYGPSDPDPEANAAIHRATTARHAPGARESLEAAIAAARDKPPVRPLNETADPNAAPRHAPERPALAAQQVEESRREQDPFGQRPASGAPIESPNISEDQDRTAGVGPGDSTDA